MELAGVVLQLKALGVDNLVAFPWLAAPPAESVVRALELLHALHALDASARCVRTAQLCAQVLDAVHLLILCCVQSAAQLAWGMMAPAKVGDSAKLVKVQHQVCWRPEEVAFEVQAITIERDSCRRHLC